jgi:hypothetical protein
MIIKKIYLVILTITLISCSSLSEIGINSSTKRIHYPGIKTGKSFVHYKVEFKSENNFTLENITLNNNEAIETYDLFSIQLKQYVKNTTEHEKGTYVLTFKTSAIQLIDNEDEVTLSIKSENKIQNKKIKVEILEPFRGK